MTMTTFAQRLAPGMTLDELASYQDDKYDQLFARSAAGRDGYITQF